MTFPTWISSRWPALGTKRTRLGNTYTMPSEKVLSAAFCNAHGLAGHITAMSCCCSVRVCACCYGIAVVPAACCYWGRGEGVAPNLCNVP